MENNIKNRGFSLVEILGVMVILGILLGMGLNTYSRYRKKSAEDSYKMMSKNAATAGEEYFMANKSEDYVTFKDLVDKGYFENPTDPLLPESTCYGYVEKINTPRENSSIASITNIKVVVDCTRAIDGTTKNEAKGDGAGNTKLAQKMYESCKIYPNDSECSNTLGITLENSDDYFNMGLMGYDFKNGATLMIRVRLNEYSNKEQTFLGNIDSTSGMGLGIDSSHRPYFSICSTGSVCSRVTAPVEMYTDRFYTITGVYSVTGTGNSIQLYVNGKIQKDVASNANSVSVQKYTPSSNNINIGGIKTDENSTPPAITITDAYIFDEVLGTGDFDTNGELKDSDKDGISSAKFNKSH